MKSAAIENLDGALLFFFALFIFGSTFSIALAQISIGLSLLIFITLITLRRYNPIRPGLKWFYLAVGAYIGWMFIACLAGETPVRSINILKEEWLFAIVPIGIYLFRRPDYRWKLIDALAAGVILLSIYGIVQYFTGVNWFKDWTSGYLEGFGYPATGNFSHRLTFGNYYCCAAMFIAGFALTGRKCLRSRRLFFYGSASVLAIVVTFLAFSRGPILSMAVGAAVFGLVAGGRRVVYTAGAIALAVVAMLIFLPRLSTQFAENWEREIEGKYEGSRRYIWTHSADIFAEHPFLGVGQGNFAPEYAARLPVGIADRRKHVHAHNDLLNIAVIAGLPGALFFASIWVALFGGIRALRQRLRKGLHAADKSDILAFSMASLMGSATFFASAFTEATFADEEVRQMLMFVWAAGLWPLYNSKVSLPVTGQTKKT